MVIEKEKSNVASLSLQKIVMLTDSVSFLFFADSAEGKIFVTPSTE